MSVGVKASFSNLWEELSKSGCCLKARPMLTAHPFYELLLGVGHLQKATQYFCWPSLPVEGQDWPPVTEVLPLCLRLVGGSSITERLHPGPEGRTQHCSLGERS